MLIQKKKKNITIIESIVKALYKNGDVHVMIMLYRDRLQGHDCFERNIHDLNEHKHLLFFFRGKTDLKDSVHHRKTICRTVAIPALWHLRQKMTSAGHSQNLKVFFAVCTEKSKVHRTHS